MQKNLLSHKSLPSCCCTKALLKFGHWPPPPQLLCTALCPAAAVLLLSAALRRRRWYSSSLRTISSFFPACLSPQPFRSSVSFLLLNSIICSALYCSNSLPVLHAPPAAAAAAAVAAGVAAVLPFGKVAKGSAVPRCCWVPAARGVDLGCCRCGCVCCCVCLLPSCVTAASEEGFNDNKMQETGSIQQLAESLE